MRVLLVAVAGAALLAGCTAPAPTTAPAEAPAAGAPTAAAPTAIAIPAIGAASTLIPTGIDQATGVLEVPDVRTPEQASWWDGSPEPGAPGPAVILGHVDGGGREGVFFRLRDLEPGDEVLVDRADGSRIRFVVDNVLHLPKSDFPTGQVYGDVPRPELRLITCGGDFDRAVGHYVDQIIAFAHQQELR